ncbi:hypothetical protein FE633_20330 [Streptomyces montanus]|uniref:SH3 domain-containing protein n=1 Tax=Streptomyces montanus TaxID=2580423 RepID=A0A5R9FYA8_9ACTN|nr:hypothetical protein [Streptomyces montanus]TLS44375.1 hypothetical protein FE633_20330 [Streptomyces montanus]
MAIAAPASAAPVTPTDGAMVTAYETVNERQYPSTTSEIFGTFHAGESALGLCWAYGDTVTDNGVTNNKWVALGMHRERFPPHALVPSYFVSAVYLVGGETGGVPNEC